MMYRGRTVWSLSSLLPRVIQSFQASQEVTMPSSDAANWAHDYRDTTPEARNLPDVVSANAVFRPQRGPVQSRVDGKALPLFPLASAS